MNLEAETFPARVGALAGNGSEAELVVSVTTPSYDRVRLPDLLCVICNQFHRFAKDCPVCGHEQLVTE